MALFKRAHLKSLIGSLRSPMRLFSIIFNQCGDPDFRPFFCMFTDGLFCSDVFPKMWSEFIGCTKSFAASCISSSDLSQFNRAVGNSINSVHKMCTNEDYQKGMTFVKWEMQFIRNQACMPNMWRMWRKTRCANWFWQILIRTCHRFFLQITWKVRIASKTLPLKKRVAKRSTTNYWMKSPVLRNLPHSAGNFVFPTLIRKPH